MRRIFALHSAVFVALPFTAPAQKMVTPPRLSPPTSSTPRNNNSISTDPSNPGASPGLYVSGKVMMEDGGELPMNVVIQKTCGSRRSPLGYADHKGSFSVKLSGSSMASLVDASDNARDSLSPNPNVNGQASNALMGCEIQAAYPGYRSASIDLGSRHLMDDPNIGTLVIRRLSNGEGTTVSHTMLTAPKPAVKSYEQGMDALRKGDSVSAARSFEKAVALHPSFANAWYELGHLNLAADARAARIDLEKAIAADARYLPPYTDLALLAYRDKNWPDTVRITDQGLRLDSAGSPDLYYYNAAAQFNQKNLDEAEKKAREAVKLDFNRSIPRAPQLLSFILAAKGDYSGAVEQMQVYIAQGLSPLDADRANKQLLAFQSKAAETARK